MRKRRLDEVDEIAYGERWDPQTATSLKGYPTYTEEQARALYEGSERFTLVVVGIVREQDRAWIAWALGFGGEDGASARAQATWYTPGGSIVAIAGYSNIDGRLFRSGSTRYTFPDTVAYYGANESSEMVLFDFRPDGTGVVFLSAQVDGVEENRNGTFEGAPVEGLWMDKPGWKQWEDLLDWRYGGAAAEMFDPS